MEYATNPCIKNTMQKCRQKKRHGVKKSTNAG